jgi:hypothetical protein
MEYIDKSIDLSTYHLFLNKKSLLEDTNMTKLKKSIKSQVEPPKTNMKVWVVNFSVKKNNSTPFVIIVGQYTLTPKLALVAKDDDKTQTFTYSLNELKKHKFSVRHIKKIIEKFKSDGINWGKLSIPITDILADQ